MSFWSLQQESVSTLFSALANPLQGIAALPATALRTSAGIGMPSGSQATAIPAQAKAVDNYLATAAAAHAALGGLSSTVSSLGDNLFSMCNTVVANSATNAAALVAPAAEYVPAPIAALAAYTPLSRLVAPVGPAVVCDEKKISENTPQVPTQVTQTESSVAPLVPTTSEATSPAMIILTALATNPQVQGMVATAITGLVTASLTSAFRGAPSPAPQRNISLMAAPVLPPTSPSPALNNRLNFGSNTVSAALMNIISARFAASQAPPTTAKVPAVSSTSSTIAPASSFPSVIAGLFSAVALPFVMKVITPSIPAIGTTPANLVPATSTSALHTVKDAPCSSPPVASSSEVPSAAQSAAFAVASPMRQELKKLALFAGRNAALAVLYYVLVKYFGPAGLSVKVAFTLATLLMDVLV